MLIHKIQMGLSVCSLVKLKVVIQKKRMLCPSLMKGEVQIQKRKIFSQISGKVVEMMNQKKTRITEEDNQKAIKGDRYLPFLSSSFLK